MGWLSNWELRDISEENDDELGDFKEQIKIGSAGHLSIQST